MSNSNLAAGFAGGTHVIGTPLTTDLANEASPGLVTGAIDRAVVKVRPMATPLDQISRMGHVRKVDSMEVDYYIADIRKDSAQVSEQTDPVTVDGGLTELDLVVDEPQLFEPSETIMTPLDDGKVVTAYVTSRGNNSIGIIGDLPVNFSFVDKKIIRMGRAATQLDVQTAQFSVLPRRMTNYCQIFKMQVEQSNVMRLSRKEVGWDFTDQQEAAIYDMRMGMEKQFLFGQKLSIFDKRKNETVVTTQGIWSQAGKEVRLHLDSFGTDELVDLLREAFTGNSGSRKKILMGGSGLIAALNKIECQRVITATDRETIWGIDFNVMVSKFGALYVVFSEIFDVMGRPASGMIIDPEFIQKHVFIPFRADRIDLRGSGQRNTEAMVLTEASCLTLRYPQAHVRIMG